MMTLFAPHYVFGYGSLLSHDSRWRHSGIDTHIIPATLEGWQRAWHTRSVTDNQTYVGATPSFAGHINGALVPVLDIDPSLRRRELNYHFVPIAVEQLVLKESLSAELAIHLMSAKLWVCETRLTHNADHHFPVYQSYVDTCLIGCLEAGQEAFARTFIESTHGWDWGWRDDRHEPRYPRQAQLDEDQRARIDALLDQSGIIKYRRKL